MRQNNVVEGQQSVRGTDEASFSSPNHLAYSSFSHIGDLNDLSFAVGLREDDQTIDETIKRIIPMSRIVPGKPLQQKKHGKHSSKFNMPCELPECVVVRRRLKELVASTREIERDGQEIELKFKLATDKLAMLERSNKRAEDENDVLQEQLDEVRGRATITRVETDQAVTVNDEISRRLQTLEEEIASLRKQAAEQQALAGGQGGAVAHAFINFGKSDRRRCGNEDPAAATHSGRRPGSRGQWHAGENYPRMRTLMQKRREDEANEQRHLVKTLGSVERSKRETTTTTTAAEC